MSEIITVSPLCHCIFCPIDIEFREESHIRNCLRSVETILGVFTWKNLRLLSNTSFYMLHKAFLSENKNCMCRFSNISIKMLVWKCLLLMNPF